MKFVIPEGRYEFTEKERSKLLNRMNKDFEAARLNYSKRRERWDILDCYVDGKQVVDRKTQQLVGHEVASLPSDTDDVDDEFFIFNLMRRIHLSNMQRLTNYNFDVTVLPNTKRQEDKAASRIARIALTDLLERHGQDKLKREIAWYLDLRGTVFIKHDFDPRVGRKVHPLRKNKFTGEVEVDTSRLVPEGEVKLTVIDPANILIEEGAEKFEDADWVEHFAVLSVPEIYRRTGVRVKKEAIVLDRLNIPSWDEDDRTKKYNNHAVLRTRYYRKSPKYGRGAIFTYTRDTMIRSTELLKFYKDIPISSAQAIANPKCPFGETWLWDLIPNANAVNIYKTALVNYAKVLPILNMQAPANSNIKVEKMDNSTGRIHTYQGEKGLEALRFPEFPPSMIQGLNIIYNSAMSLGAAHDISRQNRALSGNAIASLQQMDDSVLRPTLTAVEACLSSALSFSLELFDRFYTTPRLVRATGQKGWEIVEDFKGEMINGNFSASVSLMTGLSNNLVLRQEQLFKSLKEQVITRDEMRVHMEFGRKEDLYEKIQKQDEIVERRIKGIMDFPDNYVRTDAPDPKTGLPLGWQCKSVYHEFDNHPLMLEKITEHMQENWDFIEEPAVKRTLRAERDFHLQFVRASMMPIPGTEPQKPQGGGKKEGAEQSDQLRDSVQNPKDQPDRDMVPQPAVSGLTA